MEKISFGGIIYSMVVSAVLWAIILYFGAHIWAWGYRIWTIASL